MFRKRIAGFTLIEILVVIAIIALLASIILASLATARARSRDAKRISDIQNIQLALQTYYNDNSHYPTNIYSSGSLSPTYISSMPTDPSFAVLPSACATTPTTVGCYSYAAIGSGSTCSSYHLGANLEQSSNSALINDYSSSNPGLAAGATCTGSADSDWATPASGVTPGACPNGTGAGGYTGHCYDTHS